MVPLYRPSRPSNGFKFRVAAVRVPSAVDFFLFLSHGGSSLAAGRGNRKVRARNFPHDGAPAGQWASCREAGVRIQVPSPRHGGSPLPVYTLRHAQSRARRRAPRKLRVTAAGAPCAACSPGLAGLRQGSAPHAPPPEPPGGSRGATLARRGEVRLRTRTEARSAIDRRGMPGA